LLYTTPHGSLAFLLALVIEDYENKHWPVETPDPVEAIKFKVGGSNGFVVGISYS
jgi:HTH-type transcriptional regulator / antitoxin HigA